MIQIETISFISKNYHVTGLPEGDIYCPECAKPFKYNDAKKSLKTPMRHHQPKEKKITFKTDHLINLLEKEFKMPLKKDRYRCSYDDRKAKSHIQTSTNSICNED